MADQDDFYIGYLPEAPTEVAGHVRRWTIATLIVAWAVAALVALWQQPFAVSFFDFGQTRSYEGVVQLSPHPLLLVDRPGGAGSSSYYLVGFGKRGFGPHDFGKQGVDSDVSNLDGKRVRLEATPIYRDDQTMLEVVAGTVVVEGVEPKDGQVAGSSDPALASGRSVSLGIHTLIGEIVDSKCHLGVMKPGNRKAHRACASLCIRGGVPPVFIVREGGSVTEHLLLVGSDGRALNQEVLDWVAEPVEIHGEVIRLDDRWLLKAEPKSFKRSQ